MNRSAFGASILGGMCLILLSSSPAKAFTVIPSTACGSPDSPYVISGSGVYVLNSDLTCNASSGIIVNADDVTIKLKGFSMRCWAATGYKMSCQGVSAGGHLIRGIDVNGRSNVKIQGPGMIQGFGIGVLLCGSTAAASPSAKSSGSCETKTTPSAQNQKVMKLNVTGPDGRSDISEPFAGPRPISFGIIAKLFIEDPSTCSKYDSDDDHDHGVEIFGNAVENHAEGIALYAASRVNVHENFVHDNNEAGDTGGSPAPPLPACITDAFGVTTCIPVVPATVVNNFESHGIVVCANTKAAGDTNTYGPEGPAPACTPGISFRNKLKKNLIVDNGQNSFGASSPPMQQDENTENIDSGLTLVGNVVKNRLHHNTVTGNNGDGFSFRNGATQNVIIDNASQYNTSTDAPYCTAPGVPQPSCTAAGQPVAPHFWDMTFRGAGPYNIFNSNNDCLTQSAGIPIGVCKPGENTVWFTTP